MCLSPILIKNKSRMYRGKVDCLTSLHDTTSQYIYVNCGVCPQCVRNKQNYLIQRVQLECMTNYVFFATFTYSDDMLPFIDVGDYRHYYADVSDFQKMIKRCRKRDEWIINKYLYVTEYGGKRHRPHFHALFFVPKDNNTHSVFDPIAIESYLSDMFKSEWKRNIGSSRSPVYKPLSSFHVLYTSSGPKSPFNFHYVNPTLTAGSESDVGFYVTKYCCKFDKWIQDKRTALYYNLEPDEYKSVWKLLRPRLEYSNSFGLSDVARDYVRKCIDDYSDKFDYPVFVNPCNGNTFPLSPYLFNKYGTLCDKYKFFYKVVNPDSDTDSFRYSDIDYLEYQNKYDKFARQNNLILQKNG